VNDVEDVSAWLENPPETLEELITGITPALHAGLQEAVALQRWPDGSRLSETQLENAMQLIILYEHRNLPEEARVGHALNKACSGGEEGDVRPLHIVDETIVDETRMDKQ